MKKYMITVVIFSFYHVFISQGLQEVTEFGLDQLSDQDPQMFALLSKLIESNSIMKESYSTMREKIDSLETEIKTLKDDRVTMEMNDAITELRIDNVELRNALEEATQQKLQIDNNFTRIQQEVNECRIKIDSMRRYKRKRMRSGRIYHPSTDRHASRDAVIPSTNQTALQQVLKLLAPATCYDWKVMGFDVSGYYLIDPDGKGLGDAPFTAYCDMFTGYSFVHHNKEGGGNATNCNGPGCYKQKLTYEASMKQIEALIDTSQSCQQMISVECSDSPLSENEDHFSWWTDRHGDTMTYWAGDNTQGHSCSCSRTESCVDPRKKCNCDSSVPGAWLHDQGYLSNSSALPVTSVHFGSKDQLTETQMRYSIGPLRCFGRRNVKHPESCKDVRLSGVTHSGYHYIGSFDSPTLVFCDMENVDENFLWQKTNVFFYSSLTTSWAHVNQVVKFDRVSMNVGDAYNSTTGVFTAPQAGNYFFVAFSHASSDGHFRLRKNEKFTVWAINNRGDWGTTGFSYIVNLNIGDKIDVYNTHGTLHGFSGESELSSFMGMLL